MFILLLCLLVNSACDRLWERRQEQTSSAEESVQTAVTSSPAVNSSNAISKTVRVNDVVLHINLLTQALPPLKTVSSSEELIRSLYSAKYRRDVYYDTLTITDFHVAPLKGRENLYLVVAKIRGASADAVEQGIDLFVFSDTPSAKFLLAATTFKPEYENFVLYNVSASAYQITHDGEFALSFEYEGLLPGPNDERQRMLKLYRFLPASTAPGAALEELFEYCVYNKTGESPDASGVYQVQILEQATVTTQWKWGRALYTLVIIKTETKKNDTAAGARTTRTLKSRIYFDWEQGHYAETLRQDLGRTSS
jgi:hypothetical protein